MNINDVRKNPTKYLFKKRQQNCEEDEQLLVLKYLPEDAQVLELGCRHGFVSRAINLIIKDKTKHFAIDPCPEIKDEMTKLSNDLNFTFFNGVLSKEKMNYDGYFTENDFNQDMFLKTGRDGIKKNKICIENIISVSDIEKNYNININAIVADCEGAIIKIFDDFPELLLKIKTFIIEYDMPPHICEKLIKLLKENGFESLHKIKGWLKKYPAALNTYDGIGHEVWIKK